MKELLKMLRKIKSKKKWKYFYRRIINFKDENEKVEPENVEGSVS